MKNLRRNAIFERAETWTTMEKKLRKIAGLFIVMGCMLFCSAESFAERQTFEFKTYGYILCEPTASETYLIENEDTKFEIYRFVVSLDDGDFALIARDKNDEIGLVIEAQAKDWFYEVNEYPMVHIAWCLTTILFDIEEGMTIIKRHDPESPVEVYLATPTDDYIKNGRKFLKALSRTVL